MKITTKILVACLPGIVTGALFAASTGERTDVKTNANETALSKAKASLGKMPLSFEPNRGQTDPQVQFLSRGPGYTVFFTKEATVFSLKDTKTSNAVVRMKFVGGNNSASVEPLAALPSTSNYLKGNDPSKWLTDVKQYTKLRYDNVYPGIDVIYQGDQQQLRYDFVVKPGASASAIAMAFEGADNVAVTKDGDLALTIGGKTLVTKKPFTYQEDAGAKKEVASHYVVNNGRVTFELAKYDTTKDVVIDPTVVFITYLGGLLNDSVNGVAIVNTFQNVATQPSFYYVTGTTNSGNFPGNQAANVPLFGSLAGVNDAFVSKISFNGNTLVWSTYIGGNSQDAANAIAVDFTSTAGSATSSGGTAGCTVSGCAVVVGQTFSLNFPLANAPAGNALSGTSDAFMLKLSSDGKTLINSQYIGGITNDVATGVALDQNPAASGGPNIFVGGYTDSPLFLGSANHGIPTSSSDTFVVKLTGAGVISLSTLYGGFGEEFARGIAYNSSSKMVYVGGDTTTTSQNFIAPNNVNLPGITNQTALTGLPGAGTQARGGFVVAFDAATLARTFASYVAVSTSTNCAPLAIGQQATCSNGTETITGIAAEGGAPATGCSSSTGLCTPTNPGTTFIAPTFGNIGHIYITGATTSTVPTSSIAIVVPGFSCAAGLNAIGEFPGVSQASGCTTALVTQAPFNQNWANQGGCPYPLVLPLVPSPNCNLAAYVAILDGALLTAPVPGANLPGIGNQIEYWAYYSSVAVGAAVGTGPPVFSSNKVGNSSAIANAIAIDVNPTTPTSVYSLGYYQQIYITGSTTVTAATGGANQLPTTGQPTNPTFQEIFTPYNVGTTGGGGVGGTNPTGPTFTNAVQNTTAAFIARFNPNGVVASAYGGLVNLGGNTTPVAPQVDRSPLLHTPQFNYGEFLYSLTGTSDAATPSTVGNAIAVDVTRAALIGGATNNTQPSGTANCPKNNQCVFTTANAIQTTFAGGTDGWVSVLFFNDILTDAPAVASADPFLEPGAPANTCSATNPCPPNVQTTYLQTSISAPGGLNGQPPPFGPTFDFAISDPTTQTQTFQVLFTGQTSGQIAGITPFYVPLDTRSGANPPTFDTNLPGAGVVYYLPCLGPGGNPYPAPGSPYTPIGNGAGITCPQGPIPSLYQGIPALFSGWPGIAGGTAAAATAVTPGWLLVTADVNLGVVRLQLDRRAAAGLLEGTYVAQFLVNTYDPNQNLNASHPFQWPPCGVGISEINPFVAAPPCTNSGTPLPADNESILVTVRLVMRPSLFLSRNAGFLTGITSALQVNPIFGPAASLSQQQGTNLVPDWYHSDPANTTLTGTNGVNSGAAVCIPGTVLGQNFGWVLNANPQDGHGILGATFTGVQVPCPISLPLAPNPITGLGTVGSGQLYGATAYYGNGPGDFSGGPVTYSPAASNGPPATFFSVPTGSTPNMSFLYDAGTVQTPNVSAQQGLLTTRPDCALLGPVQCPIFDSDSQGGIDPATQRNDATVHDYYVTVEGPATLSVEAINCTSFTNPSVGNWLAVAVGGASTYTPICTAHTAAQLGTAKAPVTACNTLATGCTYIGGAGTGILDDATNGEQITLDFLTKAFSNRPAANGIPTGTYTAQVYVWATRAKNSAPGYCLGASMPASGAGGTDPIPLCGSLNGVSPTGPASDNNPNPEVVVSQQQTFTVSLMVFDTTQIIQITPNSCPANGFPASSPVTEFVTVGNSENLNTGNPLNGFGTSFIPPAPLAQNYPQFGPNGDALVVFSLLPFQTTGKAITIPCPANNSASCVPPFTGQNTTIPLPAGVVLTAQTPAQYTSCALPTGTLNGLPINGTSVPGIGTLQNTGALSQTVFVAAGNGTNQNATIYACRPTVAPAWLATTTGQTNSAGLVYPGNSLGAFPGAPEQYSSGNGATAGPVPSTALQICGFNGGGSGSGGQLMPGSKVGMVRANQFNEDTNGNEVGPAPNDPADRVDAFLPPGGFVAGDIPIVGDWTGDGHWKAGWFRPNGGMFWLDANNDGTFNAGDFAYTGFGGVGDVPVVGDWAGLGKSAIGIVHGGFLWVLDLNADGIFQQPTCAPATYPACGATPIVGDAAFAFGAPTDVPVVGNWNGLTSSAGFPISQAGAVRTFCTGTPCVPVGGPFLWLLDSAAPGTATNVTPQATHAIGNLPGVAFGGGAGDKPVTGDWYNTGVYQFGFLRQGFLWVLDGATPLAPQNSHFIGFNFAYGGLNGDIPIVGKW